VETGICRGQEDKKEERTEVERERRLPQERKGAV
jgi:hypothetical protein